MLLYYLFQFKLDNLAEGVGLEPTSPCGRRFSRAVPYQFGAPFHEIKQTVCSALILNKIPEKYTPC